MLGRPFCVRDLRRAAGRGARHRRARVRKRGPGNQAGGTAAGRIARAGAGLRARRAADMSVKIDLNHKIHVLTKKEELDSVRVAGKVVVVLDILFATTTMVAGRRTR